MRELKKVKINDYSAEINHSDLRKNEKGETLGSITIEAKYPFKPHPDFTAVVDALVPHLFLLCELNPSFDLELKDIINSDKSNSSCAALNGIYVTGIVWGGSDEHRGYTLIGQKKLSNKRVLNLISPFTKVDAETTDYDHARALESAADTIEYEACAYIDGKYAPDPQQKMELQTA